MHTTPILKGKHAVVFGAGGSIGSAVAKEFAKEGAEVFLSGRSKSSVEALAKEIAANGNRAHAALVDTLDDAAVSQYFDGIVKQTGKIDIILDAPALSPSNMGTESWPWTYRSTSSWCHSTQWSGRVLSPPVQPRVTWSGNVLASSFS